MKRCVYLSHLGWMAGLFLSFSACAPVEMNCPVATDQKSSFMAMPSGFPLQVISDPTWSSAERLALQRAMERWNIVGRQQMSETVFGEVSGVVTTLSTDKALQGCDLDQGDSEKFVIYRAESLSRWQTYGFSAVTPAVTLRCHRGDELTKQAILVNPSLIHSDQMMSVFLHELGHTVGLDHSCQMEGSSTSYRGCAGLESDHPYVLAVMFPTLKVKAPSARPLFTTPGTLEVKESLGSNDISRAGCVFRR